MFRSRIIAGPEPLKDIYIFGIAGQPMPEYLMNTGTLEKQNGTVPENKIQVQR